MNRWLIMAGTVLVGSFVGRANEPLTFRQATLLDRPVIARAMERAKTWQEAQHKGPVPTNWLTGALYTGVYACYQATGNETYLDAARDWCESARWECGHRHPQFADEICSAQTFLDLYLHDGDPKQIAHIRKTIDTHYLGADTITKDLIGHASWPEPSRPFTGRNLWWWCDALYMAPPVLARLGTATGDAKYFDLLHTLFWDAVDYLYDPEEHLFFRDQNFFKSQTPNGKKMFWGRGNGWVIGGLVRTLDYLPEDDPQRPKYLALFREMMRRIATLQGENGLWVSSLNDPSWLPEPESSGSSFFTFGLAAGINRGWLEERTYLPHAIRAWEGLQSCLREDGKLEWAQRVDKEPHKVRHEDHKNYAQGAFLLAASEMYKLNLTPERYARVMGPRRVVTVAEDGAWTWYNDERAVLWNHYLITGHVTHDGASAVTAYLLAPGGFNDRLLYLPLSSWLQADDHNNPALLPLGDDRLLALYARHNTHSNFQSRVLTAPGNWREFRLSPEQSVPQEAKVTYANLYRLESENGRLFNFFRGRGWNPNLVTSDDDGQSWSEATMLMQSGDASTRPYVKYATDGQGRIDLFYTDGHPRSVATNHVYHMYYADGGFHTSDGTFIRSLADLAANPMIPSDGTRIYDGAGPGGRGWVHDLERGEGGALAGVFISSPDGAPGLDLRYHYARYNPEASTWRHREIGSAGPRLYEGQNYYAGGICLDPHDINIVYLSSLNHPGSGQPNGTGKYQLYKGTTPDRGDTWHVEQLTADLTRDNLRPFVPRGTSPYVQECILWFRGAYTDYKLFDSEVVGFIDLKGN